VAAAPPAAGIRAPAAAKTQKKKKAPPPPVPRFSAGPEACPLPENLDEKRAFKKYLDLPLPLEKPEDNYDISDKEDSDNECESDEVRREEERTRKPVPKWCGEGVDIRELVEQQADVDPGSLFGPVAKLDMDAVFPDKLYRARGCVNPKRRRGSSQQWSRDRLRLSEVTRYTQLMGHSRRWSVLKQRQFCKRPSFLPAKNAALGKAPPVHRS